MPDNGPEPEMWSFVIASVGDCSDRTYWENDRGNWYCLCCGGVAAWESLVDPIDTDCPSGYVNGAWYTITGDSRLWPLAVR